MRVFSYRKKNVSNFGSAAAEWKFFLLFSFLFFSFFVFFLAFFCEIVFCLFFLEPNQMEPLVFKRKTGFASF